MGFNAMKQSPVGAEFVGSELENTYAELFGGTVNGGFNDGGADILTDEPGIPLFQVKSSWEAAMKFFAESARRGEFIPIVVGDPGQHTKFEIMESILENGGWVGIDVPDRERKIANIGKLRDQILAMPGGKIKS